jgi:hypothetical protein
MALHDRALVEAALFPSTSTVLTFVYCARHAKAPFGLSWLNFKEVTRDPLCLEEKQFGRWLRSQERKKAWPCHASEGETRKPPGRPPLIDEAVEAIEELIAKGECSPLTPVKVMRGTWRLFESVAIYARKRLQKATKKLPTPCAVGLAIHRKHQRVFQLHNVMGALRIDYVQTHE